MIYRNLTSSSGQIALFAGGLFIGFLAVVSSGCQSGCGDTDCPQPLDVVSGHFEVNSEVRSFEETVVPSALPNLSAASVEIAAETNKVTLEYIDSMGELVRVTLAERADGGGAGPGGG